MDQMVHRYQEEVRSANGRLTGEIQSVVNEAINKRLSAAQLEALSKANLNINAKQADLRPNFLSSEIGARVDPYETSPSYQPPNKSRGLTWLLSPASVPKSPDEAFRKWDEYGECWCSPTKNGEGHGPILTAALPYIVSPDQIIIEHIAKSATVEPGSAPKDMELLARLDAKHPKYDEIKAYEQKVYGSIAPRNWIRIGSWTYDGDSEQNIQAFPMQIDLKDFHVGTQKVQVRISSNQGGQKVPYTCLYRVKLNGEIIKD